MQAEALSDSMEAPEELGVMQAEALSDSMEAPAGLLCITHMSRCVRPGCKCSTWRRLPACVEAFLSTFVGCRPWPLVRRHESRTTKRPRAGIACMPDRLDDRYEHIRHPSDQDG